MLNLHFDVKYKKRNFVNIVNYGVMKVRVVLTVILGAILTSCMGRSSDRPIKDSAQVKESEGSGDSMLLSSIDQKRSLSTEELIKAFYREYIASDDGDSICRKYMSKAVVEKIMRSRTATDVDVVIRIQDDNEDMVESLSVENLSNDWYMVSYFWNMDDSSTLKQIPLKAITVDGALQINYITPDWYGNNHSDEQLVCDRCVGHSAISGESGLLFLKSFYDQYLYGYCHMNLDSQIMTLRHRYLSSSAKADFAREDSLYILDGCPGYDLLIDNFDFDPLCHKSIKFIHLEDSLYRVDYSAGSYKKSVGITLKRDSNGYLIDSISTEFH